MKEATTLVDAIGQAIAAHETAYTQSRVYAVSASVRQGRYVVELECEHFSTYLFHTFNAVGQSR